MNTGKIKLIATDVDGTLVKDSSPYVYPEIIPVIKSLRSKDVIFAIASGRQYNSIAGMFSSIADDLIFIAENGAHIKCRGTDMKVVKMNRDDIRYIVDYLRQFKDCIVLASAPGVSIIDSKNEEFIDLVKNGYHNNVVLVDDITKTDYDIVKLAAYRKGSIRDVGESRIIPAVSQRVNCFMSGEEWVDIIGSEVDKGKALKTIMDFFHISSDETMAFGDNGNDIGMLELAGESYAVDSATDDVKAHAGHICGSWRTKGVLQVLKELDSSL